jgi:hypothetical protein
MARLRSMRGLARRASTNGTDSASASTLENPVTATDSVRPMAPPARRLTTPRWHDPRLVIGLLLVAVAVALGAKVVGSAQAGDVVWAAARDLPAGTVVRADDVEPRTVRLGGAVGAYLDASAAAPAGYVITRDVAAGELLPAAAVQADATTDDTRLVSVPVQVDHFPSGLARGQRVDVYVIPPAAAGAAAPPPELVLAAARVADVSSGIRGLGATATTVGIVLAVDNDDAPDVVAAVGIGTVQLVLVPNGTP